MKILRQCNQQDQLLSEMPYTLVNLYNDAYHLMICSTQTRDATFKFVDGLLTA